MANLNELYLTWANKRTQPHSDSLDDLIRGVRLLAFKMTKNDDISQEAAIVVLSKIDVFQPVDTDAFTRWVRSIIKRTRLDAYRIASDHTRTYDEATLPVHDDAKYVDLSNLPDDIKQIASKLSAGYSLTETATQIGVTYPALRKRLERFRKSMSQNQPATPSISE